MLINKWKYGKACHASAIIYTHILPVLQINNLLNAAAQLKPVESSSKLPSLLWKYIRAQCRFQGFPKKQRCAGQPLPLQGRGFL